MKTTDLIKGEKYQLNWLGKKHTANYLYSERISDDLRGRHYLFQLTDSDSGKGIIRLDKIDIRRIVSELPGTPKKTPHKARIRRTEPLELLKPALRLPTS